MALSPLGVAAQGTIPDSMRAAVRFGKYYHRKVA